MRACNLNYYRHLVHLNISMNKISIIDGGFESVNLKSLVLSDNLIKEITPKMLQKLPKLQVLNLDMN